VSVFSSSPAFLVIRIIALLASVVFAGSLAAQSRDAIVAERMKPVGEVCLAGEACAAGGAAPAAAGGGEFSVEAAYNASCSMCHASGMAGAPRTTMAPPGQPVLPRRAWKGWSPMQSTASMRCRLVECA